MFLGVYGHGSGYWTLEDLRFLMLGEVLFPTDRFRMGTPGHSPRVRLCKEHMVPTWECVCGKAWLLYSLKKV